MRISWDIIGIKWSTEENYNDLWLSDATGTMGISSARSMQNTVGLYGQRSPYVLNHCQHQADQWDISWYITHGAWQVEAITWWRKRWEPQSPWAGSWFSLSVKFWVVSGRYWIKTDKDKSRWIKMDKYRQRFLVKPAHDFLALRGLYLSHFARFFAFVVGPSQVTDTWWLYMMAANHDTSYLYYVPIPYQLHIRSY